MSALTNDANIPSSCSNRVSGLSYSKMFPLFITMTRSAVRMVWTRCGLSEAVRLQQTQSQPGKVVKKKITETGGKTGKKKKKEKEAEDKVVCADPGLLVSPDEHTEEALLLSQQVGTRVIFHQDP